MEDILASIRRIIADDQLQANRPPASSGRRNAPAAERSAAPLPGRAERAAEYGEVLDLSRMANPPVPEAAQAGRGEPVQAYRPTGGLQPAGGPQPAGGQPDENAYYDAQSAAPAHTLQVAPAPQTGYNNGHAAPVLVRDPEPAFASRETAPPPPGRYHVPDQQPAAHYPQDEPDHDDDLMSPALGSTVMSAFETLAATVVLQNSDMLDRVMRDLMRPLIKTWLDENLPTLVERLVRTEIERVARGSRG